jgi:flavin-dependent dehydrogenase
MGGRDPDVLIVGGGPAGLSTWLHLRERMPRLAARTILVERSTYPRDKLCGGGLTWPGALLLAELDIALRSPSVAVHEVEFRFGGESLVLRAREAIRVVRRRAFDHELARAAVARGLELHEGEPVEDLCPIDGGVLVQTPRAEYRPRFVVGADGAHSTVRARLGPRGRSPGLARLIKVVGPAGGAADGRLDHTAVFDFGPAAAGLQGYVWHFPCIEDGQRAIDHGVYDSRVVGDARRADLRAILERSLPDRSRALPTSSWASHPVRPFAPDAELSAPHVLLVGDAAGVDPVLGEGIAPSLEYGEVAAEALVEAFESGDFSGSGYRETLFGYRLGHSLLRRSQLAADLYGRHSGRIEAVRERMAGWIAEGLP